jgi:hypothetical protein
MSTFGALAARTSGQLRSMFRRAPFESTILLLAAAYVALRLSPSSYALALGQLGADEGPLLGTPREVRTDEWSVATPLFQAAVNNDFREVNDTSFWGETLRSFVGLPLLNWGLLFKPLVWPFFLVSPALAYSFYWAATAALMLIGWSVLLRTFGFTRRVAALTSLILFFTPFVQAWSGPSPQLALFPWVLVALVRVQSPVRLAVVLAVLVPVWWLSLFYVPGLPPLLFLALALLLAFAPSVFAWRRLAGAAIGALTGAAVAFAYFEPVLRAFTNSHYPAGRWTNGGGLPLWQVASQFLPATTTEHYGNLIADNICEAATVASWLPSLALCVVDLRSVRDRYAADTQLRCDLRRIGALLAAWLAISLWQVVPLLPLSYAFGLGLSPEPRTLFASGALLLIAAAYALDRLPTRLTPLRLAAFTIVVLAAWLLATVSLQPTNELVVRDELLVLVLVAGLVPFAFVSRRAASSTAALAVMLIALITTTVGWAPFNPLQRTDVIFRKPDTSVTRELDALARSRRDGAIAVDGYTDAILNGVGYRSVTHVLATPSPEAFRRYFPDLDEATFDRIFNRYAHVTLTNRPKPFVARFDTIRLPIEVMRRHAATEPPEAER